MNTGSVRGCGTSDLGRPSCGAGSVGGLVFRTALNIASEFFGAQLFVTAKASLSLGFPLTRVDTYGMSLRSIRQETYKKAVICLTSLYKRGKT